MEAAAAAAIAASAASSMRAERETQRRENARPIRYRGQSETGPTRKWTEATRWTRATDRGLKNHGCPGRLLFRDFDGKEPRYCVFVEERRGMGVCRASSGLCQAHFVCSEHSGKGKKEMFKKKIYEVE